MFYHAVFQPVSEMGSGPEYDYPTTGKDEPIPVVTDGVDKAEGGKGTEPVVGEEAGEMDDKTIAGLNVFSYVHILFRERNGSRNIPASFKLLGTMLVELSI